MADKSRARKKPNQTTPITPSGKSPSTQNGAGRASAQVIFDDRFRLFMDTFGGNCETENIPIAIAIVCDPKIPEKPLIFTRGNDYEVARVLALFLKNLKMSIAAELEA